MWRRTAALVLLTTMFATVGCVERRISVTTEPPGALVWINDQEVGRTPLETNFKFHGVYDVRVELDGYEPLSTSAKASAPWYEYPVIDLFAEATPWTNRNTQEWHFELEERLEGRVSPEELESGLIERAGELRGQLDDSESN